MKKLFLVLLLGLSLNFQLKADVTDFFMSGKTLYEKGREAFKIGMKSKVLNTLEKGVIKNMAIVVRRWVHFICMDT